MESIIHDARLIARYTAVLSADLVGSIINS
jgi:hypothetical protein